MGSPLAALQFFSPVATALDAMPANIAVLDDVGTIVHVNRAWIQFALDNGGEPGVGLNYLKVCAGGDSSNIAGAFTDILAGKIYDFRMDYPCHSPEVQRWFQMRISPLDMEGRKWFLVIHENVTEIKSAQNDLWQMGHFDPVTGLPNRAYFLEMLGEKLAALTPGERLDVALIGIEGIEKLNALFGDSISDRLLAKVARAARDALSPGDILGQWSGGRFAVALVGSRGDDVAEKRARALMETVQARTEAEPEDLPIAIRIGLASAPRDSMVAADLGRHAEMALQNARGDLRARLFFDEAMNKAVESELGLETALLNALAQNEFVLHYQPQVDARSGKLVGVEALIRWHRGIAGGLVSPALFIPFAERQGLISKIGEWVMVQVCRDISIWQKEGRLAVPVALNVSPIQLSDTALPDRLRGIVEDFKIDPTLIELELTETALMDSRDRGLISTLTRFRDMGMRLAIDDFGTGFSNLNTLHRLPVDKIKIDRSFVAPLEEDLDAAAIIDAIVRMAEALDVDVLAEGVETERQTNRLLAHHCFKMQGYLFGRPMAPASLAAMLKTESPAQKAANRAWTNSALAAPLPVSAPQRRSSPQRFV